MAGRPACSVTTGASAPAARVWPSRSSDDAARAVSFAYIASPCRSSRLVASSSQKPYSWIAVETVAGQVDAVEVLLLLGVSPAPYVGR